MDTHTHTIYPVLNKRQGPTQWLHPSPVSHRLVSATRRVGDSRPSAPTSLPNIGLIKRRGRGGARPEPPSGVENVVYGRHGACVARH
eukprot:scaffold139510_cov202-Phaeocystis_antarctica.AAC.1